MPKTTGPLFSLGSRGSLAKTLVYSTWRGVNYARQHVIPANPRTSEQTSTRAVFAWLSEFWRFSSSAMHATWTLAAKGRPLTDRNLLVRSNLTNLRAGADLSTLLCSPGTGNAPALDLDTVSTLSDDVTITVETLSVPPGWTYVTLHAALLPNTDPHDEFVGPILVNSAAAPALAVVIDATQFHGVNVDVMAFAEFTDDKGFTQYSPSVSDQITVA